MEKYEIKKVQVKSGERKGGFGSVISGIIDEEIKYEQERAQTTQTQSMMFSAITFFDGEGMLLMTLTLSQAETTG